MQSRRIDRREFMQTGGAAAGASLLSRAWPAALAAAQVACADRDREAAFRNLSAAEAREIEAVAARILPTTDTPGAREAGVIHFIDNLPATPFAGMLDGLKATLAPFQAGIGARFPGAERFSDLDEVDQDAWLADNEDAPFFGMGRLLTLAGFFAMDSYGGNRDRIGWKLIGFEGAAPQAPPFGYYDAEYRREHGNGE